MRKSDALLVSTPGAMSLFRIPESRSLSLWIVPHAGFEPALLD